VERLDVVMVHNAPPDQYAGDLGDTTSSKQRLLSVTHT